ncbi:hypothetical protein D3C87_1754230 [compost metagenome]
MEFIHDERELVVFVFLEPLARAVEDRGLDIAHEHDVHHAGVRNEDIGRCCDHVPAR